VSRPFSNAEIDIFDTADSGTQTQESRMKAKITKAPITHPDPAVT